MLLKSSGLVAHGVCEGVIASNVNGCKSNGELSQGEECYLGVRPSAGAPGSRV